MRRAASEAKRQGGMITKPQRTAHPRTICGELAEILFPDESFHKTRVLRERRPVAGEAGR
eukprot:6704085-Pyramimonas_sp.AAC.1